MKLVALFTLVMMTAALAQNYVAPRTIKLVNKDTQEVIGTVTMSDNRLYYRDMKGEHFATVQVHKDGTRTMYDPSGKVIERPTVPVPVIPE